MAPVYLLVYLFSESLVVTLFSWFILVTILSTLNYRRHVYTIDINPDKFTISYFSLFKGKQSLEICKKDIKTITSEFLQRNPFDPSLRSYYKHSTGTTTSVREKSLAIVTKDDTFYTLPADNYAKDFVTKLQENGYADLLDNPLKKY